MNKDDSIHLAHILENVELALKFSNGLSEADFYQNDLVRYGCVRAIEVIGEASKNLSDGLRVNHPEVDWKGAMGMRDRLAHNYLGIDYSIVWETVTAVLPTFKTQIETIISDIRQA